MKIKRATGISLSKRELEWTTLAVGREEPELIEQQTLGLDEDGGLENVTAKLNLRGKLIVALSAERLLVRMLELPAQDPDEIRDMAAIQADKIFPLPAEDLVVSYELLEKDDSHSKILLVAVSRQEVDRINALFQKRGFQIHSLDVDLLGWFFLMRQAEKWPRDDSSVVIIARNKIFNLFFVRQGTPIAFRTLDLSEINDHEDLAEELSSELNYTLLTLESQYGMGRAERLIFWHSEAEALGIADELRKKSSHPLETELLQEQLPPLSEGIVRRFVEQDANNVELIPLDWKEAETRRFMWRRMLFATGILLGIWLICVIVTVAVFSGKKQELKELQAKNEALANPAERVKRLQEKVLLLEAYAKHDRSSLECMREITEAMSPDLKLTSLNYRKDHDIQLSGWADNDREVYDFFANLEDSDLFPKIENQRVSNRSQGGRRSSSFSLKIDLKGGNR